MSAWFAAVLLYETEINGKSSDDPLCELSIRVLQASALDAAEREARVLGSTEQSAYPNENGEEVVWRFRGVLEVQELGEAAMASGAEVFSRLFRRQDAKPGVAEGAFVDVERGFYAEAKGTTGTAKLV